MTPWERILEWWRRQRRRWIPLPGYRAHVGLTESVV